MHTDACELNPRHSANQWTTYIIVTLLLRKVISTKNQASRVGFMLRYELTFLITISRKFDSNLRMAIPILKLLDITANPQGERLCANLPFLLQPIQ